MDELSPLLEQLGLGRYASVFAENEVDLDALRLLSEQDLIELGLPLGPRRKLLAAFAPPSKQGSATSDTESPQPSQINSSI